MESSSSLFAIERVPLLVSENTCPFSLIVQECTLIFDNTVFCSASSDTQTARETHLIQFAVVFHLIAVKVSDGLLA